MSSDTKLYDLVKELQELHSMHAKQQQATIMKSKLELRNTIRECLQQIDDMAKIPPTFCDNVLEKQTSKEPHLKIERKCGQHLQEAKNKIDQLFVEAQAEANEVVLPVGLENWTNNFRMEVREHKDQLRRNVLLIKGFERMSDHIL